MASVEPFQIAWPDVKEPPAAIKKWVDDFYHLADNQETNAGERLAQLFTPDATMHGLAGPLTGREAIAASRPKAWITQKERRHEPRQVYTTKADYSDILVFGQLKSWFKNGEIVDVEFIAGITFSGDTSKLPLCSLYRVWGDSAPWMKAMSKKE
ncbi:uncharacterized protein A1O5_00784 [Cladophialophora psammophila CBS 110553]|uniref:SnoaL-like domain-containing protein n=1 Tax=Cladophialophora psammophila CBS 110553 TaxID=1182543 RepID=W9XH51_9EURO|nr:uncharacterized protein A1O5_00784 [Cladophialophora psammophila CBS 110553]EXJ76276.1 hypothetical protein A1O5_00784 [Cladophialophora psammophila CBS 110553]